MPLVYLLLPQILLCSSFLYASLISETASIAGGDHGDVSLGVSSSELSFPKTQAKKFIRSLNLFPEHEFNRRSSVAVREFDESGISEMRINLPFVEDSIKQLAHHAGYYRLPHSIDARMFYFFFESRANKSDPVVIWLTGGPGCSGALALFYENGPYHITKNLSLTLNKFGWDKVSNLIFVDQPIGTGFSYTSNEKDIRQDEEGVSNDLYDFLQAFFKEHPHLRNNDFYITGESYAGHYIPALASRINQGNKNREALHINLKGIAIGNGLTNPGIQYGAYADFALDMKLITQSDHDSMNGSISDCQKAIGLCGADGRSNCELAYIACLNLFENVLSLSGDGINYYDVRTKCVGSLCYDFSMVERFLNLQSVKNALGVGDIDFVSCSSTVSVAMTNDHMRNLAVELPTLLEDGIKLLVYAGEYDLICNWLGNSRWVHAMEWSGQEKFVAAPTTWFAVNGTEAGLIKGYGPLQFLRVHDAGHMVPMDQPKRALKMLSRWMEGKL